MESGSIGLKICRVADGTADAFFKACPVRDWDIAPGHLILEEAGGSLADGAGDAVRYGGSRIHEGLVAAGDGQVAGRIATWHRVRLSQRDAGTPGLLG